MKVSSKRFLFALAMGSLFSCQTSQKDQPISGETAEISTHIVQADKGQEMNTPPSEKSVHPKGVADGPVPKIVFAEPRFDFGEIFHAEKVSHEFQFVNQGVKDLEIKNVFASCGCTKPTWPVEPIAPGASGKISIVYNSVGKQGFQRATIRVITNDPANPEVRLKITGRVKVKPREEES